MASKKNKCVRCEVLERPQQHKSIYVITDPLGEKIPLCAVCLVEMKDEEDFFKSLKQDLEEDEFGSEDFDQ